MKNLIGTCVFAQSGGPTSVINASFAGVVTKALQEKNVTAVYGAIHGIQGVLTENFIDMSMEDADQIELLKFTPASALGSVRYKLKDLAVDDSDYQRILEVFKKYNVRYFFYNGGNDSMDTCNKISKFMKNSGYDINVIGVPKTIDNDLFGTDHCPGYGSASKYIATSIMEINRDAQIYQSPLAIVVEIMGRNAGWLTASAGLAGKENCQLIYLPEVVFNDEKFIADVKNQMQLNGGRCIIAVSEGVKYINGDYVGRTESTVDNFGHSQLGGVGNRLKALIENEIGCKCKNVELNILQRCASHLASMVDIEETFNAGQMAVASAIEGNTDCMVTYLRLDTKDYSITYDLLNLESIANKEKTIPLEWINNEQNYVTNVFVDYALPLIQGQTKLPYFNGLPQFANLKKIKVSK